MNADAVEFHGDEGMTYGARAGAEFTWATRVARYQARGGLVLNSHTGSGGSFGVGFTSGKLQIDVARVLGGVPLESGQLPTFFSMRVLF